MRNRKKRCCRELDVEKIYKPMGIPTKEIIVNEINLDEFEAMRLCDLEQKNQIEAGELMGVSRGTIQRLLTSGRKKIMESFLESRGIKIINK